jgi:hypothetical protein
MFSNRKRELPLYLRRLFATRQLLSVRCLSPRPGWFSGLLFSPEAERSYDRSFKKLLRDRAVVS